MWKLQLKFKIKQQKFINKRLLKNIFSVYNKIKYVKQKIYHNSFDSITKRQLYENYTATQQQ